MNVVIWLSGIAFSSLYYCHPSSWWWSGFMPSYQSFSNPNFRITFISGAFYDY